MDPGAVEERSGDGLSSAFGGGAAKEHLAAPDLGILIGLPVRFPGAAGIVLHEAAVLRGSLDGIARICRLLQESLRQDVGEPLPVRRRDTERVPRLLRQIGRTKPRPQIHQFILPDSRDHARLQ
jgi:hypothetical protein